MKQKFLIKKVIILLFFSLVLTGCACKPQKIYIKQKCPELQPYEYNYTIPNFKLHYKVIK